MDEESCKYDHSSINTLRLVYIFAIILWIVIIWYLELYNTDFIGGLILFIPIIYYIISMYSLTQCDHNIENEIFQYDVFLFGGALIAILISNKYSQYASYFYKLIFVGVFLAALSITDIFTSSKNISLYKHIKVILQTASTFVFVYLFYTMYFVTSNIVPNNRDPFFDFQEDIYKNTTFKV